MRAHTSRRVRLTERVIAIPVENVREVHRPIGCLPVWIVANRASNRDTSRKYVLKTESERLLSTGAIISLCIPPECFLRNAHPTVTSRPLPCDHHFAAYSCYDARGSLCCHLQLPLCSSRAHRGDRRGEERRGDGCGVRLWLQAQSNS